MRADYLDVLAQKLSVYFKSNGERGALYGALKLVASMHQKNIDRLLVKHDIHDRATLDQDHRALIDLGFPDIFFFRDFLGTHVRRKTWGCLIMAAATILLFNVEEAPDELRPAPSPGQSPSVRVAEKFTLALVLKGIDLHRIDSHSTLSLDDVTNVLEKATYFACTSEYGMNKILSEVNVDEQAVDRESEQPVLVPINFQHYQQPPAGGFANKLQISQHLRQGAMAFGVGALGKLIKSGNLISAGFIRS